MENDKSIFEKKIFILSLKMLWTHFILDLINHFVGTVADHTPSNQEIVGSKVQIYRDLSICIERVSWVMF